MLTLWFLEKLVGTSELSIYLYSWFYHIILYMCEFEKKQTKSPKILKHTYMSGRELFNFSFLPQTKRRQNAQEYKTKLYKI